MTARVTLSTSKTSTERKMMKTTTTKYTLVYRPVLSVDFDKHGNCHSHLLEMDVRPEYVYDNETDEAFSVTELPAEVREVVEEYLESLELVRFFQPGPEPDAPF
jgi:hypothetical protein